MGDVMVRVPKSLLDKLRDKFPELRGEDNTTIVRVVLRKVVSGGNAPDSSSFVDADSDCEVFEGGDSA